MQDKELDELFRAKLEDFREQPSARVWDTIAAEVVTSRHTRSLLPFISIAASVLVLVAAALFFLPGESETEHKKPQIAQVPNKTSPEAIVAPGKDEHLNVATTPVKAEANPMEHVVAKRAHDNVIETATKPDVVTDPVVAPQVAEVVLPKQETLVAAMPESPADLSPATAVAEDIEFKTQFRTNAPAAAQNTRTLAAAPAKKRGIHSIGDLINVVVSKVDKRKDKIIEFSNDEDDESTITGLNLGIVKIKKDQ